MGNLNLILKRVEEIEGQIRLINQDYAFRGLPKGRAFAKKMGNLNNAMSRAMHSLEVYGTGTLTELSLLNLETGESGFLILSINPEEINNFIETMYPGWSILSKKHIPLNKLGRERIIR
jgi:hypothetical protein